MSKPGPYRINSKVQAKPIKFRFNGRTLTGFEGDSVASALLGNGIRVVSRSFKFHRPRGIFSAGLEEPNALVQVHSAVRSVPSARAPLIPLEPNLEVFSHSGWPSISNDLLRAIDFVHPIFAAGFYNKTFIWPKWKFYEPIIRKLASEAKVPTGADPDRYDTRHAHCDVLVIGAGPAGEAAVMAVAPTGQRVLWVEQDAMSCADVERLKRLPNVQFLPRTMAVAYYDQNLIALVESVTGCGASVPRERLWLVRTKKVVLATGAIEQPMIFSNNDRPGIMLASAALKYLKHHGVAPGRQVVIATNNDTAYSVARELREAGVNVIAITDTRSPPATLANEMGALSIQVRGRTIPVNTAGFSALRQVSIGHVGSANEDGVEKIACDALLVSGGWSPTLHLFAQAGGKLKFSTVTRSFTPMTSLPDIEIVGFAGSGAEGGLGERIAGVGNPARQWVDLRHDVTVADIDLAVRENYAYVEHIKRYTTLGMSLDQGKVGQAPAAEVIARACSVELAEIGHTTFRPPFVPVTLGTLVGRNIGEFFTPIRRTPLHAKQAEMGALFEDYGEWKRAAAFLRPGESREQAIHREVRLVRNAVGVYDASPLGKIEVIGPDALDFVDRFYINNLTNLKPKRARYGIMLRETGIVFDDGTITILDDDRVVLTTTSGSAGRVYQWLEEWRQCEWPHVKAIVMPVTDQWATIAIAGQHARSVLARLRPQCDLSNELFPHLDVRLTKLLGIDARIYRVSFSGELSYEINVPANKGPELWAALLEEGDFFGIEPYGIEALLHLRMEKGFLHVGTDTDGTTVPDDIGFGKPATAKKRHYIGKRSLTLEAHTHPDRLQLIGLEGATDLPVGSHLRLPDSHDATDGWITSAGSLSTTGTPVAMAMLRAGRNQIGKFVKVFDAGAILTTAKVVEPMFYDPTGARMNA